MTINPALYASDKTDWGTPQAFFDRLNAEFHFDLDAAASAENTKCRCFYTKEQNGLLHDWGTWPQSAWCNPPYGRSIGDWIAKAHREARINGVTVVVLIPSRTDTAYWHDYVMRAAEVRFVRGRLKFEGAPNQAPFPSAVIVFRPGHQGPPLLSAIDARSNQ